VCGDQAKGRLHACCWISRCCRLNQTAAAALHSRDAPAAEALEVRRLTLTAIRGYVACFLASNLSGVVQVFCCTCSPRAAAVVAVNQKERCLARFVIDQLLKYLKLRGLTTALKRGMKLASWQVH
jgi:hypothetical protein